MRRIRLPCFVFCALLTAAAPVRALDLGLALPSTLQLAASVDDEGGNTLFLDLDYALPGGQRLALAAGRSHSVSDEIDISPRTLRLGVASDPLDQVVIALALEDWGQKDEITTRTLQGDLQLSLDDWRFTMAPGMRRIEIFLTPGDTPAAESVVINASTLEAGLGVYLSDDLFVSGRYFDHDYSTDPSRLQNARAALISPVTFSLAAGLESHGTVLGARFVGGDTGVGLDWSRSVSALDDARTDNLAIGLDFSVSTATNLRLGGGVQRTEDDPDLYFADTALLFSF